ncbi:response regulator [Desulfurispirillum indicum]|uniref:Response regulator receiver n=1 Tax=Desulfurispirillum indicum (strain ATCC BAA-1389 / DSM 22839 / S5) TaxID=653733 RepID=E6W4E0_DESIS|nr:response regulator [Desulfurispirillum indicum]ADU65914.1 response regulator receiver [Desulfurispirillum indicum S5]UCZ57848.1 response regulator [Desulfurispirillum indicum]
MATILLIEDNELNCDMLTRRLTRKGYEVITAGDGAEGLRKATEHQPDLILMDMSLPVMDGWEATRRIRDNQRTTHIPVLALTAHALPEDRRRAFEVGCSDFETKPVHLPQLLEKIADLLEKCGK